MISSFRGGNLSPLAELYLTRKRNKVIPATIEKPLLRKLDMIASAQEERDLFSPPSNYYKRLSGQYENGSSIRVNLQWRLMFQWHEGSAKNIYLDPHHDT